MKNDILLALLWIYNSFQMLQMFKILVISAILATILGQVTYEQLAEEIRNTKQLIKLYNKKLVLLEEIYSQHYPHTQYPQLNKQGNQTSTQPIKTKRLNQKIILLKKLTHSTRYAPGGYLVNNNKILDVHTYEELGQFIGDVLVFEPERLTTLVVGKLGVTSIKKQQKSLIKEEYLTGQDAEQMDSVWHRNINIKEAEDVLVQWNHHNIFFRYKELKQMSFNQQEHILNVFSLNQYKLLLVTNQRVAAITRTRQLSDSHYAKNFSKVASQHTPQIVCADYSEYLLVLLSTGQLARLLNQRIIVLQTILNSKQDFKLQRDAVFMQFLDQKLFIAHKKLGIIKIYNFLSGKFILNVNLHIPVDQLNQGQFQFYKINGSIRLIISTHQQSNIYELLLPTLQDTSYSPNYFKIVGIIAAIGCFLYFKMRKETNSQKDDQLGRNGVNRLSYSPQIEQFLKKQIKDQHPKHKKN